MATSTTTETIQNCTVFISYQWGAQPKVKQLFQCLNELAAINPWMDIYKIRAGMNLFQSLATTIQTCDVLLACVSRNYVKSKNCEREIIYADCFNKPIIPLYIEKIPINELGSIGFLLARERYCNLYKDDSVFNNLSASDEFIDILNGIEHVLKTKGKIFAQPLLTKIMKQESLNEKINDEVMQFRNDQPLEIVISAALEEKETEEESTEAAAATAMSSKKMKDVVKTVSAVKSQQKPKSILKVVEAVKPKQTTIERTGDFKQTLTLNFEVHPLIRELEYLKRPVIVLDPIGDRIYGDSSYELSQRGGLPYIKPKGWQRFGLKVSLLNYPNNDWLAKDGNQNEWAVGYHGLRTVRYLHKVLFDENNKFNPSFKPGMGQKYKGTKDINKLSDNYGKPCGIGMYFSSKIESAQDYSTLFIINDQKYKVILQCRINPKKSRMPPESDVYILSNNDDIRPYGILVRKVVAAAAAKK